MKRILEVQKQIGVLGKDSKNPFFKSAYLDLNKLLIHVTPLLHENGLVLLQPIENGLVCSKIYDSENGSVLAESSISLPNITDPQKLGSAITYFRRYTLKSLLSIAEGDDDGNLASKPEPIVKSKLEDKGFEFLTTKGTKEQINQALKERDCTEVQITGLNMTLKELDIKK
tara:strand:+ start:69 stop:581 length:513 start_codon:yes stop_codon:yes gene_type:complete